MEQYIKISISDITYLSELIPPFGAVEVSCPKGGINSQTAYGLRLTSFTLRKSSAH